VVSLPHKRCVHCKLQTLPSWRAPCCCRLSHLGHVQPLVICGAGCTHLIAIIVGIRLSSGSHTNASTQTLAIHAAPSLLVNAATKPDLTNQDLNSFARPFRRGHALCAAAHPWTPSSLLRGMLLHRLIDTHSHATCCHRSPHQLHASCDPPPWPRLTLLLLLSLLVPPTVPLAVLHPPSPHPPMPPSLPPPAALVPPLLAPPGSGFAGGPPGGSVAFDAMPAVYS